MKTKLYRYMAGVIAGVTTFTAVAAESPPDGQDPGPPLYWPWSVAAGIGSDGIFGVGASWRFSDHLGMRLGVNGAAASFNHLGLAGINYDAKVRLLNELLTFDAYFWKTRSLHLSLGAMFSQNELTGTATASGNNGVLPGGATLLSMKAEYQPVSPYLSIAGNLFYFDRAHRWAMPGEIGMAYLGSSRVNLSSSGPGNPAIAAAASRLERYIDQYKWWPVVKLGVSYSF